MSRSPKMVGSCVAVAAFFAWAAFFAGAEARARTDGAEMGGLRIRLLLLPVEKDKTLRSRCALLLENVGAIDLNVNLGQSLANGRSLHPTAVHLLASSAGLEAQTLIYSLRVAGRVDPFVVPLPVGSTYTLQLPLDKFSDSRTGVPFDHTAREYKIRAELVGEAVGRTNEDVRGLALISYWQGKLHSNEVKP